MTVSLKIPWSVVSDDESNLVTDSQTESVTGPTPCSLLCVLIVVSLVMIMIMILMMLITMILVKISSDPLQAYYNRQSVVGLELNPLLYCHCVMDYFHSYHNYYNKLYLFNNIFFWSGNFRRRALRNSHQSTINHLIVDWRL